VRLLFLTATPLNPLQGSGTFAGIHTLARALTGLGVEIDYRTPDSGIRNFTLRRLWFNHKLRSLSVDSYDAVVGFDMDGYRLAGRHGTPHIASIKGIIADEMRFERGPTRWSMAVQAACEARHVRRADAVFATSRYAARRLHELYGIPEPASIVPELIDLAAWRDLFQRYPAAPDPARFTVLTVCRFYPRKRLHLLLEAAARLRERIPHLEVRIVGGGPEQARLYQLCEQKRLGTSVRWLGDLSQSELAAEYQRADVFCLASVQEGFGIVFLETMAAGKPIVAARAAAVPEVVTQGLLVEPESGEALAEAIHRLYREPELRASLASEGDHIVERYDAPEVARLFLEEIKKVRAR